VFNKKATPDSIFRNFFLRYFGLYSTNPKEVLQFMIKAVWAVILSGHST